MKGDIRRFRSRDEGGAPVVLQTRAEMAAEEAELGVGRLTGEVAEVGRLICVEYIYLLTRGGGAHGELQDGRAEHGPGPRHHLQPGPRVLHQPLAAQQVSAGRG